MSDTEKQIEKAFRDIYGNHGVGIKIERSNTLEASPRGRYRVTILGMNYHVFVYSQNVLKVWNSHAWSDITIENITKFNRALSPL